MTGDVKLAAQGWSRRMLKTLCDVIEPWDHGTVFRATAYPTYWNYNVVQVDGEPGLNAAELMMVADEKLAGMEHRRIDFLDADAAESVRPDFETAGWKATRLVWMHHDEPLPPGESLEVEEVDYDAVIELRREWNHEDFPDIDQESHIETAKGVSMTRGVRVLASLENNRPVGFAQLEYIDGSAEITHVFVSAKHR